MMAEPTWPDPPVTNTRMGYLQAGSLLPVVVTWLGCRLLA
jgi:hypothetical protein